MANKRKILSIFAHRFVPDWIEKDAPGFKKFIEYYLKFLEEHYYIEYQNFLNSIDVDIITDINESTKHVSLREELNTLPSVGDIFKGYSSGTEGEIYKVLDKANFYIKLNSLADEYEVFPILDDNEYGFIKGVDPYDISSENLANYSDWTITNMIHNGSVWIAGTENGKLYSSPDGETWTLRYNGSSEPIIPRINDMSIGEGLTVVVCNGGKILTSPDGITWSERSGGFLTDNITGIAHGDVGFTCIGGTVGDIKIATSSDGITWTQQSVDFSGVTILSDIEFGFGQFMVGGDNNFIATSLDGITWTESDPGFDSTDPIISISYQNQKFVVGSINNKISISENGEVWERNDGSFSDDFQLRKVIYRGSTYYLHLEGYDMSTKNKIYYTLNFEDFFEITEDFSVSGVDPNIRDIAYSSLDDKFIIANDYDGLSEYYIWELIFIENLKQIKTVNDLTQEFFIDLFLQQYGYNLRTLLKNDTITLNSKSAFIKNIKKINVNKGTRTGFNTFFNSYRSKDFEDPNVHIRITDELFYDNVDDTVVGFSDPINEGDPFPERYEPIPFMYKIETNLDPAAFREVLQSSIHPIGFRMIYDFISSWNEILATDRAGGSMEDIETEFSMVPSSDYTIHTDFDLADDFDRYKVLGKINDYVYAGTFNGDNFLIDTNDLSSDLIELNKMEFSSSITFNGLCEGDGKWFAVGNSGTLFYSDDKIHWIEIETGYSESFNDIEYSSLAGFVIVGSNGLILNSSDGFSWTQTDGGLYSGYTLKKVKSISGYMWIVGADSSWNGIIIGGDGSSWLERDSDGAGYLHSISYKSGRFVCVGFNSLVISDDGGTTWTSQTPFYSSVIYDIDSNDSIFVSVGASGKIFTSTNGIDWTERSSGTSDSLKFVVWDSEHSIFITYYSEYFIESSDGITWSTLTYLSGTSNFNDIIVDSDDEFVVCGSNLIYATYEGGSFFYKCGEDKFPADKVNDTITLNDRIIVFGKKLDSGTYYSYFESFDGITWTRKELTGITELFRGIYFNSNLYLIDINMDLYKANISDIEGTIEEITDFTGQARDLVLFNGKLIVTDSTNEIIYWCPITDTTDWNNYTLSSSISANPFLFKKYQNTLYLFSMGKIAKTSDGINWEDGSGDLLGSVPPGSGYYNLVRVIGKDNNELVYIENRQPIGLEEIKIKHGNIDINTGLYVNIDTARSFYDLEGIVYNNGYWFIMNHRNGIIYFESPTHDRYIGYV